jgi:hypothetical protein
MIDEAPKVNLQALSQKGNSVACVIRLPFFHQPRVKCGTGHAPATSIGGAASYGDRFAGIRRLDAAKH